MGLCGDGFNETFEMNYREIIEKLSTKTVGIAGCGGLGSNCAVSLVRCGLGNIVIADFDRIEEANLNRQYFFLDQVGEKKVFALKNNLLKINQDCNIDAHDLKLKALDIIKLFKSCDVIVEAFDDAEQKEMIIECVLSEMPDTPIVSGLGLAGYGNTNSLQVQQFGNLYVCGDSHSEVSENDPPLAPRVGVVSNMQANQVLELLLDE